MNTILFDTPEVRVQLMPFTLTRPVCGMRVGILTIREKWEKHLGEPVSVITEDYLSKKYPVRKDRINLLIHGALCPDEKVLKAIHQLRDDESLSWNGLTIAAVSSEVTLNFAKSKVIPYTGSIKLIDQPWKIFVENGAQIRLDFELLTRGRKSAELTDPYTRTYAPENIFLEEGASAKAAVLNAATGPIYLAKNSEVQEGSVIRGPFSLGEGSIVNMAGKMRGDITIGPHCKVGGEISNAVLFGYSSKAHDGFLGSSVLGEWCNLGADTNTSNLKNNYEAVKLWSYAKQGFVSTGMQFCGLMMGDHSKCGINTMFNTGTVVGVGANIFGGGYPRNFIPSFAWGGSGGFTTFQLPRVYETAQRAMERRQVVLDDTDKAILSHIFEASSQERIWERQ